jgi:hypothetical protein
MVVLPEITRGLRIQAGLPRDLILIVNLLEVQSRT